MKTAKYRVPAALEEVWEAKRSVAADIKDMTGEELRNYLHTGLGDFAKDLGAQLVRNPDGTYRIA